MCARIKFNEIFAFLTRYNTCFSSRNERDTDIAVVVEKKTGKRYRRSYAQQYIIIRRHYCLAHFVLFDFLVN